MEPDTLNQSNCDSIPYASVIMDLWREGLERQGGIWLRVVSSSMYPLIGIGDWVWVEPITAKSIKIGDIVVFFRAKEMCVHRIIHIFPDQTTLIEKGDFNTFAERIQKSTIVGIVTRLKKGEREIDFTTRYWRWINRGLTIRSRIHKFWHEKIREKIRKFVLRFPEKIRNRLILTYNRIRLRITPTYLQPSASAPFWMNRLERIKIGGKELLVRIPPGEKEMAEIYQSTIAFPENQGILFVFGDDRSFPFHSRNTSVPLSIAFFNKDKEVIEIIPLPPFCDGIRPAHPAAYALVVNQNWYAANGISLGEKLEIEGF